MTEEIKNEITLSYRNEASPPQYALDQDIASRLLSRIVLPYSTCAHCENVVVCVVVKNVPINSCRSEILQFAGFY